MRYSFALTLCLTAALAAAPSRAASQEGSVSGTVLGRFEQSVRPLPFATVDAWSGGYRRSVAADSLGRYQLASVPAGTLHIRASHPGHDPVEVDVVVPSSGPVLVDLELDARPLELPPMDVTTDVHVADPSERQAESTVASRVEVAALEIGTGVADAGLVDAMRAFGGNDPANADDVLFMRGSTTDLKLVLLDGAPVYTPFHVAGLLRSFEPAVLGRADLHVGGAPARYDGGLTYILDLQTRQARRDRMHASGSMDLLAATAALDGPLGDRAGVVASARALHNLGQAPLGTSPYGYRDALVSLEGEPAPGHRLRATGFWNRESVVLDFPGVSAFAGGGAPDEAWWSNQAVSGSYQGRAGRFLLNGTVAAAGYEALLPLQPTATEDDPKPEALLASARTDRIRGEVEAAHAIDQGMARFGVSWEKVDAAYAADPLTQGTVTSRAGTSTSTSLGGYVDVSRSLARDVTIRAGLRADHFSGDGGTRVAPRVALNWEVSPDAVVTVATGRYHQSTRATDGKVTEALNEQVNGLATGATSSAALLPVATADHVVVSFDQVMGEDVRLGISGFWKDYKGLRVDQTDPIRSSGVDLRIQRYGERGVAWLGYGLSWYWSGSDLSGSSSDFTGRQLLTAGISGPLGSMFGGDIRIAYGSGLPYTSVALPTSTPGFQPQPDNGSLDQAGEVIEQSPPLPGGPPENFLRLDVEVRATFTPEWGGHGWRIEPYVRVLNALDRRDALFYAFQRWRSDALTPLAERPLVPVVGVSWIF